MRTVRCASADSIRRAWQDYGVCIRVTSLPPGASTTAILAQSFGDFIRGQANILVSPCASAVAKKRLGIEEDSGMCCSRVRIIGGVSEGGR